MTWLLSETRKLMTRARAHAEDGDTIRVTIEIIARKPSRIVEHRPPREGVATVRLTRADLLNLRERAMELSHRREMRRITADYWEHWVYITPTSTGFEE